MKHLGCKLFLCETRTCSFFIVTISFLLMIHSAQLMTETGTISARIDFIKEDFESHNFLYVITHNIQ